MVTRDDVLQVAKLARLRLDDAELDRLAAQIGDILSHVEELEAVPLGDAEAVGGIAEGEAPRRVDQPDRDALSIPPSGLAPEWADGLFVVPRLAAMEAPADDAP